jgi:hypothetical protein
MTFGHENLESKQMLSRIVSMLTKLAQREYSVREENCDYDSDYEYDYDYDYDYDRERIVK